MLLIKKLRDNKKQKDITVEDAPKSRFSGVEEVSYRDDSYRCHSYRLYSYPKNTELVSGQYKRYVTKYKGSREDAPIDLFAREGDEVVVERDRLVHQLVQLYGEGAFYVYKFGGTPHYNTFLKRTFIEVVS